MTLLTATRDSRTGARWCDALFYLLLAGNVARTLHHAMWRDELDAFQISANSPTLLDLFARLRYEARPPLWDLLLWGLTRLTTDPVWMQVLHAAIATAIWVLVYRAAPFGRLEKFLLLTSYFLFFEYFVISRNYALAALLGLGFVALRQHRPAHSTLAWLALGLMANLVVHAAIWSMAFASVYALEQRRHDARFIAGAALYLALLAFAVIVMIPAPDFGPWEARPSLDLSGGNNPLAVMFGAFVPIDPAWFPAVAAFLRDPQAAPVPFTWGISPAYDVMALTGAGIDRPFRFAAILSLPIAACAVLTRNPLRVLEFSLAYAGLCLFATFWHFTGSARHHGLVFVAFVAAVWTARAQGRVAAPWLFAALLAVNAFGGVVTLGAESTPFSQSRTTARWIAQNDLAATPLIGSRDAQVSSVAGYLRRPVYYLECECDGTFIVWNGARVSPLSPEQFRERLARAVARAAGREALLILNRPLEPADVDAAAPFAAAPLTSFVGSVTNENYWLYRLTKKMP